MNLIIKPVRSKSDLRLFTNFIYRHYQNDNQWVAPLRVEEKKKFSSKTNPMLLHCECELFLLLQNNRPIGRIAAFIDHLALKQWNEPIGLFGLYECIDNADASRLLLETAQNWLREKGMKKMRGPWSFTSQEWGLVVNGYTTPMIMAPYNFPYYNDQLVDFGLKKVKDLMVYELNYTPEYKLPDKIMKYADLISQKTGVTIRAINKNTLKEDVKTIVDVGNEAVHHLWGQVPITDEEGNDLAKSLKMVMDEEIILIAEVGTKPVGFVIALPDINTLIKGLNGRLFPFGIFKLLFGLKKIRSYRVWAMAIIPGFTHKAIDALFYKRLYEVLSKRNNDKIEANYVLENNMAMNNPILNLGFRHSKTYRVYEMGI